jgi:hypothetical protein
MIVGGVIIGAVIVGVRPRADIRSPVSKRTLEPLLRNVYFEV